MVLQENRAIFHIFPTFGGDMWKSPVTSDQTAGSAMTRPKDGISMHGQLVCDWGASSQHKVSSIGQLVHWSSTVFFQV